MRCHVTRRSRSGSHRAPVLVALLSCLMAFTPAIAQSGVPEDLKLGEGLYARGLYDRAVEPLERVRSGRATPDQLESALVKLGESYRLLGRYPEAAARFGELLERFPSTSWRRIALLGRGESLVRSSRPAPAIPLLETLLQSPGEQQPGGLYWLAEAQADTALQAEAMATYRRLISSFPDHELRPSGTYKLGILLRDAGQPGDALAVVDALPMESVPAGSQAAFFLLRGDLALGSGDAARALEEYRRARSDEEKPDALVGICLSARELDDRATFLRARQELFALSPDARRRGTVDLVLGAWEAEAGRVDESDALLLPLESGEDGREASFWRGWARLIGERPAPAAEIFLRLRNGDDEWARRAAYRLEYALRQAKQWEEALRAALYFLKEYGGDVAVPDVIAGGVESAYRLGEDDTVVRLEEIFVERYPDHELSRLVRRFAAEALLRQERYPQALDRYRDLWPGAGDTERAELAPRLAWADFQVDPGGAAERLAPILPGLPGPAAAEVGVLIGRSHEERGASEAALDSYSRAAAADPDGEAGDRAALRRADLLASTRGDGAPDPAVQAYEVVLARADQGPVEEAALIQLAELLAAVDRGPEAIPHFRRYLERYPAGRWHRAARLELSFCLWQQEQSAEAEEILATLPADGLSEDQQAEALYLSGRIAADLGSLDRAVDSLESYRARYPEGLRAMEALRELARYEEQRGRRERAVQHLELYVSHPEGRGRDDAHYQLAWLYLASSEPDRAERAFEQLLEACPDSALAGDVHYRLGDLAYEKKEYDSARSHYRRALDSPEAERLGEKALYRIAWSHAREEAWSLAGESFEELANRFPEGELKGESLFLASDAFRRVPDLPRERKILERFVAEHRNHEYTPEGTIRLAECLQSAREWTRIRAFLEPLRQAELEDSLRYRHRVALGRCLVELDAARSAIPLLEEAREEGQAVAAEAQYELGRAYRVLGDRDRAIETFINGSILYPYRPWATRSSLEAGRELIKADRKKEAIRVLQLAAKEDPDGPEAAEARRLLESLGGAGGTSG